MNSLLPELAAALLLTIVIEYLVLFPLIRIDRIRLLLIVILINSFTNPLLNFILLYLSPPLLLLEGGVMVIEAVLLYLLSNVNWRYALICSFCANGASLVVGKILMHYIYL